MLISVVQDQAPRLFWEVLFVVAIVGMIINTIVYRRTRSYYTQQRSFRLKLSSYSLAAWACISLARLLISK